MSGSLRERIADELRHNDECGPGPVSRSEYLLDADAIVLIVREFDREREFRPDWRVHPGETLQETVDEHGLTQTEVARRVGCHPSMINLICNFKAPITARIAVGLEEALGGPGAQFWMNLQSAYDIHEARERREAASVALTKEDRPA